MQTWFRWFGSALVISIALAALLMPAILNGYPLLSQDTATHLYSGKQGFLPADRPYYYGLFIRHIGMNASLWFPVLFQALFVYAILLFFIRKLTGMSPGKSILTTSLLTLVLCGTTSLAVFTSYIIPDVFAGIGVLAVILFLADANNRMENLFLAGTVLFCACMHLSHVPLMACTALFCLVYQVRRANWFRGFLRGSVLILSIILILPTLNFLLFQKFVLSESGYVFLTARLSQSGIIKDFQEKHPLLLPRELALEKGQAPHSAIFFLWDNASPLYKNCPSPGKLTENEPAYTCFRYKNTIYKTLIKDMFRDPAIVHRLISTSFFSWKDQLFSFAIDDLLLSGWKNNPNSELCKMIAFIYPGELGQFKRSVQYNRENDYRILNYIFLWNIIAGSFFLLISLFWSYPFRNVVCVAMSAILVNAGICGCLSDVADRYQARILWMIPILVFVVGYELIRKMNKPQEIRVLHSDKHISAGFFPDLFQSQNKTARLTQGIVKLICVVALVAL